LGIVRDFVEFLVDFSQIMKKAFHKMKQRASVGEIVSLRLFPSFPTFLFLFFHHLRSPVLPLPVLLP
jgi:hypothetical protein